MYVCYVGESGDPGKNGSTYLLLGAVAIFEGRWRNVREDLDQLILKYFPPPGARPLEIHLADVRRGKAPYRGMYGAGREEWQINAANPFDLETRTRDASRSRNQSDNNAQPRDMSRDSAARPRRKTAKSR